MIKKIPLLRCGHSAVFFLILAWSALLVAACQKAEITRVQAGPDSMDPVVMTVNGETVSANEYRLVMERRVAGIYSLFKESENLDDYAGYWSDARAEGPLARLRQGTREELVRIKVDQGLARQRGLLRDSSYRSFRNEFAVENDRRSVARREGKVIYGPSQYRESAYYYLRMGELVFRLRESLAKEAEAGIADQEIEKFYRENRSLFGKKKLEESRPQILSLLGGKRVEEELRSLYASAEVITEDKLLVGIVPRVDAKSANDQVAMER